MRNHMRELTEIMGTLSDLKHAAAVLEWDQQTYMPSGSTAARARQLATLQKLSHDLFVSKRTEKLLNKVQPFLKELSPVERDYVAIVQEDFERERKIPSHLVEKLSKITSISITSWAKARAENNFSLFLSDFEQIITTLQEIAECISYTEHPYDALISQYERGFKTSDIDALFTDLRKELVPLISSYTSKEMKNRPDKYMKMSAEMQKKLIYKVIEDLGFDFNYGRLDESIHPFTTSFTSRDVRLTTRLNPQDFTTGLLSAIHECGHGLYEQNIPEHFSRGPLGDAASFGFHESQSRFYENVIGRSLSFWEIFTDDWKRMFNLDDTITAKDLYKYVNTVQATPVRTEADELTYNLHIIIRFDLERSLLKGNISPQEIPEIWNEKYNQYLGIIPNNHSEGALQDIHWAAGLFGYFPTYTIGNLISLQLKKQMEIEIQPLETLIHEKRFSEMKEWFNQKIHLFGKRLKPKELLYKICNESLNTAVFTEYIHNKYIKLY